MSAALKAPFPYFGGKSKGAEVVWRAFGDVPNYVEPFFGSGAVLLGRPHEPRTETVNDLDCYLANFWRAVQADPEAVAHHADWPVNEADLHARHLWLVNRAEFRERMKTEPEFFDVEIAGRWVWGLCQWIGSGWCALRPGQLSQQLPHLGNAGRGASLLSYLEEIAARLRGVRVACGDWSRVVSDAVTWRHGTTAILLDPPYDDGNMEYVVGGHISGEVRAWALAEGHKTDLRIALCGYEGEHEMPGWFCHAWKSKGGYGVTAEAVANAKRERIWFSPHCLPLQDVQPSLFGVSR